MLYLTLRQYEYVIAIAKAGSMSGAAKELNVSQPALSVAVQTVEAKLGQALFLRRKGAAIQPTGFAVAFLDRAEALVQAARALEDPKTTAQTTKTRVRLGCFSDLAPRLLAPKMKLLRKMLPDLDVVPRVADFETLASEILDGSLDLAITYDLGLDATFERSVLDRIQPHAFVAEGDDLAAQNGVTLTDLAHRELILFEEGLSIQHMLGMFSRLGLRPTVAHRVVSLEVMRSFAANGEGVGISYTAPAGDRSYDGLPVVQVPILDAQAQEDVVATFRKDMARIAPIDAVLEVLKLHH